MLVIRKAALGVNSWPYTAEKKCFIFSVSLISVLAMSNFIGLAIIASVIVGLLFQMGLKGMDLIKILILPLGFLFAGSMGIAFNYAEDAKQFIWSVNVFNQYLGISELSLTAALFMFAKALTAVLSLFYLIISCSISDICNIASRIGVPKIFLELFNLTYRYIFLVMNLSQQAHIAQKQRLGYASEIGSIRSVSMLLSSLFVRSISFSTQNYQAMLTRGYDGDIPSLREKQSLSFSFVFVLIIFSILLIAIGNYSYFEF